MKSSRFLGLALLLAGCQPPPPTAIANDCIDPTKINLRGMCPMDYTPVCGCDGKTYSNACTAANAGVRRTTPGPCPAALAN